MEHRRLLLQATFGLGLLSKTKIGLTQSKPLHIGVLPNVSPKQIHLQYEPMQHYMGQKLDGGVTVSTTQDWSSFYKNVKADKYDIVISAIHVARLMQLDFGLRPIATYQPNIKALLITKKGQPDLKSALSQGMDISLSNPASLVAMEGDRMLEKAGLKRGIDFNYVTVKGDDSVGLTLIRGAAAAGILSMGEFNAHPQEVKDQLQTLQVFAEVPSFVVMASKRLESATGNEIGRQLADFSESSADGKLFEKKSGFRIMSKVNQLELISMDVFVDKTRRLLV
jgi:phosphonate transport system substrate-binding protein